MKLTAPPITQGTWTATGKSIIADLHDDEDEICIANIEDDGGYEAPTDQQAANQKAIAALPKLLKSLEQIKEQACDAGRFYIEELAQDALIEAGYKEAAE